MLGIDRTSRFCETIRDGLIAQPANSWSSIIFFGVVVWYLATWTKRTKQFINGSVLYSYIFILNVLLIGAASFWGHSGIGQWGGAADFESMFLLITLTALLGISWLRPLSQKTVLTTWILINIPLTYVANQPAHITDYTFMFFVFLVMALELAALIRLKQTSNRYFWLAIGSLAVGYGIWQLDVRGIWCEPMSWWQGHALWHLLAAFAAGFLYIYLATKPARILPADRGVV